jgi:hypothetical protein
LKELGPAEVGVSLKYNRNIPLNNKNEICKLV